MIVFNQNRDDERQQKGIERILQIQVVWGYLLYGEFKACVLIIGLANYSSVIASSILLFGGKIIKKISQPNKIQIRN